MARPTLAPIRRPLQVTWRIEIVAQRVQPIVSRRLFRLRREGIGVRADLNVHPQPFKRFPRRINRRADHFRLAAVEQQRLDAQLNRHCRRLGHWLARTQTRHFVDVFILQGKRQPERLAVLRQTGVYRSRLNDRALGFRQP